MNVERVIIILALFVAIAGVAYLASIVMGIVSDAFDDADLAERGQSGARADQELENIATIDFDKERTK